MKKAIHGIFSTRNRKKALFRFLQFQPVEIGGTSLCRTQAVAKSLFQRPANGLLIVNFPDYTAAQASTFRTSILARGRKPQQVHIGMRKLRIDVHRWMDSKAVIAVTGIIFTIVFGVSNCNNQKLQSKIALIPHLSSTNPMERKMGLDFAEQLDREYAVRAVSIVAKTDPEPQLREKARKVLETFSTSNRPAVSKSAQESIDQVGLMDELRRKGLLSRLGDAQGYIQGGTPNGYAEAVKIYREILDQLSTKAKSVLDSDLLSRAREEEKNQNMDLAARNYAALFADFELPLEATQP